MKTKKRKILDAKTLNKKVFRVLKSLNKNNLLEDYATFMGRAQILEMGLKGLLIKKYRYKPEKIERWTLGKVITELEERKLRKDFIGILKIVLKYRNYIAHELLWDFSFTAQLVGEKHASKSRLQWKHLEHGLYYVIYTMLVFDFLQENNYFSKTTSSSRTRT